MPGKPVAPPEYAAMLAGYIQGMSFGEISKAFGRARSTIGHIAHRDGWPAKREAAKRRAVRKAETSAEKELARIMKIQRDLRDVIWNKIARRLGPDGQGDLGIPRDKEVETLLQTMRDQLRTLGIEDGNGMGGVHVQGENVQILLGMPKDQRQKVEKKLLADLGMVDPAELDDADVEVVE